MGVSSGHRRRQRSARRHSSRRLPKCERSSRFAEASFVWDDARLDTYLTNPQAMVPGSNMAYRQPKAETRAAIIAYLKELN